MEKKFISSNLIFKKLNDFFKPEECIDVFDKNGIQFGKTDIINKIYTMTFASEEGMLKVLDRNEKNILIFTHHPVPPRPTEELPYPDIPKYLVKEMINRNNVLFSYHIPLDRINPYSPSYQLALNLGLEPIDKFYEYNGVYMGQICDSDYKDIYQLANKMKATLNHDIKLVEFGNTNIKGGRIAVMAGCAKNAKIYEELKEKGINVFITGVTNENINWVKEAHEMAKINKVNILGGTHYSTEKFALISLVDFFEGLGVDAEFIEETPNLMDI